jgi:DHA2 family multidrug resistance protein
MFSRDLIANRNLVTALGFMVLIGMMMFGIFALFPPMLQSLFGYSVLDTGILLAPRGLGILASMFIASRLAGKLDARIIVATGFILTAYSLWKMTQWSLDMDWHPFVITGLIQGLGMGFVFIPMNALAFATLGPNLRTDGSSLLYLLRNLGGSMGISVMTATLARNVQVSHEDLAGHVTAYSMSSLDPSSADRLGGAGEAALRILDGEITRQAAMIAYLDDFTLMMFAVIVCIPFVSLLRPAKTPPAG